MGTTTQEIIKKLRIGIEELFETEKYAEYLRFLSRFHSYSASNCLLIAMQCPDATLVASYTDWQRQKRQVKRGARAITILAPHTYKKKDADGNEHECLGFHAASVFDVSATYSSDGKELPNIVHVLDGALSDQRLLDVLIEIAPVPVEFENITTGANGYFSPSECRIVIKTGLSEIQTAKTLLHETSHAWLHAKGAEEENADQRTREVQAESVAYTVCCYLGLDTSEYSFGYIAGWSKDRTLDELKSSIGVIARTADRIITDLEDLQKGATNADIA